MLEDLVGQGVGMMELASALVGVIVVAYVVAEIGARLTRSALAAMTDSPLDPRSPVVRRPIQLVRLTLFVVVVLALAAPALALAGVMLPFGLSPASLIDWALSSGLRVLIIALLAWLLLRIVAAATADLKEARIHDGETDVAVIEQVKRAQTLGQLLKNAIGVLVISVATLMILRELNIDIVPILTGAGVVGLAVGFGAQTLVKDLIAGFFLLLENQVRVGDVIQINGQGGLVERIRLRTITLRDLSGTVHVFPNGSITTLSNLTKDFSFAVLDIGVAYKEDTDQVVEVLQQVAAALEADPDHGRAILEPLEVLGVDDFADSQVTIKVRFKTKPIEQWAIAREFRRRIKKAFDARGIEIPFPHLSLYFGEASKPITTRQGDGAHFGRMPER